jgi:hypothetical protein
MAVGLPVNFNAAWNPVSGSCPARYDVYLGFAFNELFPIAENLDDPAFTFVDLNPDTRYYWRVIASNCCGETEGPVWSFTTNDGSACQDELLPGDLPEQCFRFELDTQGFTIDNTVGAGNGLWHWSEGCYGESPHLYFGRTDTCLYDTGSVTQGIVTSPELDFTALSRPALAFDYFVATEAQPGLDVAAVLVSANSGPYETVAVNRTGQDFPWLCDDGAPLLTGGGDTEGEGEGEPGITPTWKTAFLNLGAYAGDTVRVRFAFNSVDAANNDFPGFGVDNVCFYETGDPAPETANFCQHLDDMRQADILNTLGGYGSLLEKLAPATGDLNGSVTVTVDIFGNPDLDSLTFKGNKIQDGANELALLSFILNNPDFDNGVLNHAQVKDAWNQNWNQLLFGNLGGQLGNFLPTLEPGFVETLVAWLTLGDGEVIRSANQLTGTGSFGLVAVLLQLLEEDFEAYGFGPPADLILDKADFATIPALAPTGDADGDTWSNRQEALWFTPDNCGTKSTNPAILYTVAALDPIHFPAEITEGEGDGEGGNEGEGEGEGEGDGEGGSEGEGEGITSLTEHDSDQDGDGAIDLGELLRLVQFYNVNEFHCDEATEDGYAPGSGDQTCERHSADYNPNDWRVSLSELLRVIQLFNAGTYHCAAGTEDGYAPGPGIACPF